MTHRIHDMIRWWHRCFGHGQRRITAKAVFEGRTFMTWPTCACGGIDEEEFDLDEEEDDLE